MTTSHIDDLLYEPIAQPTPTRLYPFGVGDFVRLQIGVILPFGAIVCSSINDITHAVEVWVWSSIQGMYGQIWIMPGPDCIVELIRKATPEEIGFATAQGMLMAA